MGNLWLQDSNSSFIVNAEDQNPTYFGLCAAQLKQLLVLWLAWRRHELWSVSHQDQKLVSLCHPSRNQLVDFAAVAASYALAKGYAQVPACRKSPPDAERWGQTHLQDNMCHADQVQNASLCDSGSLDCSMAWSCVAQHSGSGLCFVFPIA